MNHKMRTKSSQLQLSVGKPSDNPRQGGLSGRVSDVHFTMLHAMLMSSSEGEQEDTHACALPPLSHRPGHEGWQDQSVNLKRDPFTTGNHGIEQTRTGRYAPPWCQHPDPSAGWGCWSRAGLRRVLVAAVRN